MKEMRLKIPGGEDQRGRVWSMGVNVRNTESEFEGHLALSPD